MFPRTGLEFANTQREVEDRKNMEKAFCIIKCPLPNNPSYAWDKGLDDDEREQTPVDLIPPFTNKSCTTLFKTILTSGHYNLQRPSHEILGWFSSDKPKSTQLLDDTLQQQRGEPQ